MFDAFLIPDPFPISASSNDGLLTFHNDVSRQGSLFYLLSGHSGGLSGLENSSTSVWGNFHYSPLKAPFSLSFWNAEESQLIPLDPSARFLPFFSHVLHPCVFYSIFLETSLTSSFSPFYFLNLAILFLISKSSLFTRSPHFVSECPLLPLRKLTLSCFHAGLCAIAALLLLSPN